MGYVNEKTKKLALELADNIENGIDFDLDSAKSILMSDFDILTLVMQVWFDNDRVEALNKFQKCLTNIEKQVLRLELAYRESEV